MPLTSRDIEEELRQLMMGIGDQPDLALDVGAERARLAQLGAGMTDGMGEDLPRGTKVNFAADLETKAPESAAARAPIVPKVVEVPGAPADDFELAAARVEDRRARAREAFERGSRELVGGLTRTQAAPAFKQPQDAEAKLLAARDRRTQDAQRNETNRATAAKFNFERAEAARKAAIDAERDRRDFEYRRAEGDENQELRRQGIDASNANAAATRALAGAGLGLRREEADIKRTERAEKQAAGVIPLVGGTFSMKPGLSDSDRSKARDYASSWNTAIGAVDGVTGALSTYLQRPSPEAKGEVEAQLTGALTALNVAYKQGAMAETEARRLSAAMGVDLTSPVGIAAAVSGWLSGDPGRAGAILQAKVQTLREASKRSALNSLSTYGDFSEGGAPRAQSGGGMSDVDQQALDWAKANPDDSRSKAILERLGVR